MRCRALGAAMSVPVRVSVRGPAAARSVAARLGCVVAPLRWSTRGEAVRPDLLIVDDPSRQAVARHVARARAAGVPVATLHDLGLGLCRADLSIDGTVAGSGASLRADLAGPEYAVLHPRVHRLRAHPPARQPRQVLVALGGGRHVRRHGAALAAAICAAAPDVVVVVAAGFSAGPAPALPARCRWLRRSAPLVDAMARASVAVVSGGVTLYEACATGTPAVALAVVPAQRPTIRAFARTGAVIDAGGAWQPRAIPRAAAAVVSLVGDEAGRAGRARRARALVDGRGGARVARHLFALVSRRTAREVRDAA
jgi:hypothetical protein